MEFSQARKKQFEVELTPEKIGARWLWKLETSSTADGGSRVDHLAATSGNARDAKEAGIYIRVYGAGWMIPEFGESVLVLSLLWSSRG